MLKILIQKHGIPETIYSDKHTIFKSPIDGNLTQFGRICKELGINLIFAGSPQAKGKVEKKNDTVQGRLLNDIIRHKIKSYTQLNQFFNNFYADYLNKKIAYKPAQSESLFVPLDKDFDLSNIFFIKERRKILNGCLFSFNNNYYQILSKNNNVLNIFKGTEITVMKDVFDNSIKVEYRKQIYKVIQVANHLHQQACSQQVIHNQKELEQFLNNQTKKQ